MVLLLRHAIAALFICHESWVGEIPFAVEDKKASCFIVPCFKAFTSAYKKA